MEYTEREQVIIDVFNEKIKRLKKEITELKLKLKLEKIRKKRLEYLKSIQ